MPSSACARQLQALAARLAADPIASAWSADHQSVYLGFAERLFSAATLTTTIGKGGLSFYQPIPAGTIFVAHFNAQPRRVQRRGQPEQGFADFRGDTLQAYLDMRALQIAFQALANPVITPKLGKCWWSLHFPLDQSVAIADWFIHHIIVPLQ